MLSLSEYEETNRNMAGPQGKEADTDSDIIEIVKILPQKYRVVIHLFYYEQLSVEEIASGLHIPEGTVKSRLHKARALLRKRLEAYGYEEGKRNRYFDAAGPGP